MPQTTPNELTKILKNLGKENVPKVMMTHNDDDTRTLRLHSGDWNEGEWILKSGDDMYITLHVDKFNSMFETIKSTQQEIFRLKLEKAILQEIPIDFKDVWTVAMDEIQSHAISNGQNSAQVKNMNLEKVVEKIKKSHPNLFVNLKNMQMMSKS